jgi:O-antigen/teichoic acid export membrane protein
MGMILLAKQESKIFILYSLVFQAVFIVIHITSYNILGLFGLGISYTFNIILQFVVLAFINKYKYNIIFEKRLYRQLIIVLTTVLITIILRKIDNIIIKYLLGAIIFIFSCLYSYKSMKKLININLWDFLKNKINDSKNKKNN